MYGSFVCIIFRYLHPSVCMSVSCFSSTYCLCSVCPCYLLFFLHKLPCISHLHSKRRSILSLQKKVLPRRTSASDIPRNRDKPKADTHISPASNDSTVCVIQPDQLTLLRQLGKGSFGIVNEARWMKADGQTVWLSAVFCQNACSKLFSKMLCASVAHSY